MASIFSSEDQSPFQTPLVRGWMGCAARAQAKTCGSNWLRVALLVWRFARIGEVGAVVGLVPEVPGEDARIVGEGGDDALDVGLETWILRRVSERGAAGALHPA